MSISEIIERLYVALDVAIQEIALLDQGFTVDRSS